MSQNTQESQTAQDFITSQLELEAEAREALPYQFDTCTKPLGPLRQSLFSCLTCNPPPTSNNDPYTAAALCYSCSISCHGEHELVELFTKRNTECDCGTTRITKPTPCTLRLDPATAQKGNVIGDTPRKENKYDHNYAGRFCGCEQEYDPAKEKGTMFQCLGLASAEDGGCAEDWWHPECLMGLPRTLPTPAKTEPETDHEDAPLPSGFPHEDDFDHLICHKCVAAAPWIKQYASTTGFLPPVYLKQAQSSAGAEIDDKTEAGTESAAIEGSVTAPSLPAAKRKAEDELEDPEPTPKKAKVEDDPAADQPAKDESTTAPQPDGPKHTSLPEPPSGPFSLFVKEDFRDHFCRCPECFPRLAKYPQLLEEEESYEPPMSESDPGDANGVGSVGSGSTYERGEALLSNVDRVRAIEGVMVYNQLRDKVKTFLQPFAESGQAVSAEDIKAYFEKLRGDDQAIKLAGAGAGEGENGQNGGDSRKEQGGY